MSTTPGQLDSLMVKIFHNPLWLIEVKNVVWPSLALTLYRVIGILPKSFLSSLCVALHVYVKM